MGIAPHGRRVYRAAAPQASMALLDGAGGVCSRLGTPWTLGDAQGRIRPSWTLSGLLNGFAGGIRRTRARSSMRNRDKCRNAGTDRSDRCGIRHGTGAIEASGCARIGIRRFSGAMPVLPVFSSRLATSGVLPETRIRTSRRGSYVWFTSSFHVYK